MGNRKGISSAELFGNQYEKSEEVKAKYSQLSGAKAISSDMFFDDSNTVSNNGCGHVYSGSSKNNTILNINLDQLTGQSLDDYKEAAAVLAGKVSE